MNIDLAELWAHRDLWLLLARRDLSVRYRQTALGLAWALLQPLAAMAIFGLVFGGLLGRAAGEPGYPLFVLAGLVPWMFCSQFVSGAADSLIEQPELLTRVYFPRLLLPLGVLGYVLVDTLVASALLALLVALFGPAPTWQLCLLPLPLLGLAGAALGAGLLLSAWNVKYRDVRYAASLLQGPWQLAASLNPLTGLIEGFRACVLGTPLHLPTLLTGLAVATLLFLAGLVYFRQVEAHFADLV